MTSQPARNSLLRPCKTGDGFVVRGKRWSAEAGDFEFEDAELLISLDDSGEFDIAVPDEDDHQKEVLVSVPLTALIAVLYERYGGESGV